MKLYFATITALSLLACQPAPKQPVQDAGDASVELDAASPAVKACANLRRLGCAEGNDDSCVVTIEHVQSARITDLRPDCLAAATTKAEARACKSVQCP
ncbi:MAG: hypothetical protein FWD69_19825 [Polyangiaceae bacterium]|nr:hypothetical protein [Polyangiaceae bacterium]